MRKALLLLCLILSFGAHAQLVVTTNQTPNQLVQDVLLGAGVTVSNVKFNGSAANANLIRDQAAHFNDGIAANLGIETGVVLSTGQASFAAGPNAAFPASLESTTAIVGDPDLQILAGNSAVVKSAVLEFDFIPTGENLSFDFVFGSKEYPTYAPPLSSGFNDAFGFFLSGPGINGTFSNQAINIALVPGTTSYVTINNVNPVTNPQYFISNPVGAPGINYGGFTVIIPAQAQVQCGAVYHIKLAIGNVSDNGFDSAVFLKANSFSTTPIDLGGDLTVAAGTALCNGDEYDLCTGLDPAIPHQWYLNDVAIPGATNPCYTVLENGTYKVVALPYGVNCPVMAQAVIEVQDAILPPENVPPDLFETTTLFDLTEVEADVFAGENAANFDIYYFNSQFNAENGIADIADPTNYIGFDGEVIFQKVESLVTSGCNTIMSFTLRILPCEEVDNPADVVNCDSYILPALTHGNYFTQTNGGGTALFAGDVISNTSTLFVYLNEPVGCEAEESFTVTINPVPTITDPTPLEVCDDNYDGLASFDLTTKNDEIAGIGSGLTVQYFETDTSTTPIANVTNYGIINANTYTLTVRVFDPLSPECFSTTTLVLVVNPKPAIAPITAYPLCETSIPEDGIEAFDLNTKTAEIINGQANIEVTYYTSQALAQGGVAGTEISTAAPYNSASAQIWVRLENTVSGCFAVTSFNLVVNARPIANEPAAMNGCSNGIVNTASFNLNLNNPQVNGATGIIITYHLTLADAIADVDALPTPYVSGPAIVFIRVENTATGCFNTTQVQLNVTQGPTANTPTPLEVCDPNSDGWSTFNLADANEEISGGPVPAGVTITYHETFTDAEFGENALPSIYDNNVPYLQTIWVNVSFALTGCSNIVELQLIVNNTPVATEIPALEVCDDNADGSAAFDLTTAIAGILNTIDPTTHTVSFYPTQANATAGTAEIVNVTSYNSTTQTIWVRVENNDTGCFDVISLDLVVNALPLVAAPIPAYTLCDVNNPGDQTEEFDLQSTIPMILNGQDGMEVTFYFDQANAEAQTNALPFLYTNISNAQTIWVTVKNLATGCFVTSRMDLRVVPLPVLYPPTGPVVECDQDGNGFAIFDLDALVADLLQGEPNTDVTFHLTEQDAITGTTAQTSPFENTTAFIDFIWVRAENTLTGCFSILAIELNVTAAPKIPALDPIVKCDEDSNNQNGFTTFDLTVQTPIIVDAQTGAGPYTVTYYTSEAAANAGVAPIIQDTFYTNNANPQTIWVRIDDDNSDCFAVKSFEISVNLPILLTRPTPLSLCDDGPTTTLPQTVFDLTIKNEEIVGTATGYSIVYFPSWADAQAGTNAITDPTAYTNIANAQTLGVMVTSADGCVSYTTMDIRVLPLPTPRTDLAGLDIEGCEDTLGSEEGVFDLTQNEEYIADEDPNLIFEYYLSEQDAIDGVNAIADPTNYVGPATTIWIKVMNASVNYLGDNCYVIIQQNIVVNGLPVLNDPTEYKYCDIGATGTAEFTLNSHNDEVLEEGQDLADFTFAYYLNQADAEAGINELPNLYTNITNPQDIVVAVTHGATSCKSYAVVTLVVAEGAVSTTPTAYATCDTDADGILIIDLETLFSTEILGAQVAPEFTVSYYPTLEDAQDGTNAIDPATAYSASTGILFAAVNNTTTGCRSLPVEVAITIEALPNPVITSDNPALCVDFVTGVLNSGMTLNSNLDPALYTFEWSLDGVVIAGAVDATYSITTVTPGVYSVVATSVSALGCPSAAASFTVIKSGPAVAVGEGFTVSNAFTDNQTLTVTVEGFGDYVYSLDNGPFLDNDGIFLNITPGLHTVVVRDLNSCEDDLVLEVFAINYPHFFTPNGDGFNDTWNIPTLASDLSAKIYIFDRYGKLIKQISPSGEGWNGTFNGKELPSSDYWFTVFYLENGTNKEFKAHFSLKR